MSPRHLDELTTPIPALKGGPTRRAKFQPVVNDGRNVPVYGNVPVNVAPRCGATSRHIVTFDDLTMTVTPSP